MSFEVVNQPATRKTHQRTISALESPHNKRVFGVRFSNIKEEQAAPYELNSRALYEPRLVHVKIFKDENNEFVFLKGEKNAPVDRRHSVSSAKTSAGSPTFI
jgi:hypothetical protein